MSGKLKASSFCFYLALLLNSAFAADANQNLGGQLSEENFEENYKDVEGESPYLSNKLSEEFISNQDGISPNIPGEASEEDLLKIKPEKLNSGILVPGAAGNLDNILTTSDSLDFKARRKMSNTNFSFFYTQDNFNYQNDRDIYQKTYRDAPRAQEGGSLHLGFDWFFVRSFIDLFINAGAGFGFNSGKGVFVTGEQSDTSFKLWTLPVDLGLGLSIPISSYFKLTAMGGGSALGLYQSRGDREKNDEDKYVRQVGYGYYAQAKLQISLSGFMDQTAFEMYRDYQITNMLLDFIVRNQNYSSFGDPITVDGLSYGVGFSFEYL